MRTENALGSWCLYKPAAGRQWFASVNFMGAKTTRVTGFDVCDSCLRALKLPGRTTEQRRERSVLLDGCRERRGCRRGANEFMAGTLARMTEEWRLEQVTPRAALVAEPARVTTLGELFSVSVSECGRARSAKMRERYARASVKAGRRVVAIARDLWVVKVAGIGPTGVKIGNQYPDAERIDALPLTVLTHELARDYFRDVCPDGAEKERRRQHVTPNSTMELFREMFSKEYRERVYEGKIVLPECVDRFLKYPLLAEPLPMPQPFAPEVFDRLVTTADALKETDPDLYLCARVIRQTMMRSGSVAEMRADWVVPMNGKWQLVVQSVKENTAVFAVPITAELAAEIQARPGYTFGDDSAARKALVNTRHNEFVKSIAGRPERGNQGNHRFRDTGAGALMSLLGKAAAAMALGHAGVTAALDHYARVGFEATPTMEREYRAFLA